MFIGDGTNKVSIQLTNPKQYWWGITINNYNGFYPSLEGAIDTFCVPAIAIGGWSRSGWLIGVKNNQLLSTFGAAVAYLVELNSSVITVDLSKQSAYFSFIFYSGKQYYWTVITSDIALV